MGTHWCRVIPCELSVLWPEQSCLPTANPSEHLNNMGVPHLGSILPTFNAQLFRVNVVNVLRVSFLYLHFRFVHFGHKSIGFAKMLVTLTPALT